MFLRNLEIARGGTKGFSYMPKFMLNFEIFLLQFAKHFLVFRSTFYECKHMCLIAPFTTDAETSFQRQRQGITSKNIKAGEARALHNFRHGMVFMKAPILEDSPTN